MSLATIRDQIKTIPSCDQPLISRILKNKKRSERDEQIKITEGH
jgi:hypothetical protein